MTILPDKPYLRPDEVAEYLGVSRQSVYDWLRKKKLSHIHTPGGQSRIPKGEVERLEKELQLTKTI